MRWTRFRAWLLVDVRLRLALNLLVTARRLLRAGVISDAQAQRAMELSIGLNHRANVRWKKYLRDREILKTDLEVRLLVPPLRRLR